MSSKYQKKQNGRGKPVVPPVKLKKESPVFDYTSVCCQSPAKKKACVIDKALDFKDRNKLEHSLGTWNCTNCRKACKVTRAKHVIMEEEHEGNLKGLTPADVIALTQAVVRAGFTITSELVGESVR